MSFPGLRSFYTFTDYQANRAELTESSCENVETDSNCQATCHLVKEIKKEESQAEGMANLPLEVLKIECLKAEVESSSSMIDQYKEMICVLIEDHYSILEYASFFHPPENSFPNIA